MLEIFVLVTLGLAECLPSTGKALDIAILQETTATFWAVEFAWQPAVSPKGQRLDVAS